MDSSFLALFTASPGCSEYIYEGNSPTGMLSVWLRNQLSSEVSPSVRLGRHWALLACRKQGWNQSHLYWACDHQYSDLEGF